jgi:hypothetical protein
MTKEEKVLKSIIEDLKSDYEWADRNCLNYVYSDSAKYSYYHGIRVHCQMMLDRINDKLKSYEN